MIYPPANVSPTKPRLVSSGGAPLADRSPSTVLSFGDVKPEGVRTVEDIEQRGSLNPAKPKFYSGFNTSLRHLRANAVPLEGVARAERSVPFLAGYDAARVLWANNGRPETTNEVTAAVEEAFAVYLNGHHGTNLSWDDQRAARG
jgi:hypothetical protein